MKKEYQAPLAEPVRTNITVQPLCASVDSLSPLEESNDMEGLHWS